MIQTRESTERLKKSILSLLGDLTEGGEDDYIYREMLFNIAQVREEKFDVAELRLLNKAFRELRHSMKVFKPYRSIPKAAVFGSARTKRDHPDYKIAQEFGKKLAKKGWMIITGGASGIMEAAMVGAGAKNSFGLNILLPFEQEANEIIRGNAKLMFFKYFFTRKLMFLKESAATVLFPGGFGTFDEGFESFTLVQTGKAKPRPLVLVDSKGNGYWKSVLDFLRNHMKKSGLISPPDLSLMNHFQDPGAAADEIVRFYSNYHSSRFYKDQYLIRVRRRVTPAQLAVLDRDFKNLLISGKFERMRDISNDDEKDPALDRIVFSFDKTSFSRLRELIDALNTFGKSK